MRVGSVTTTHLYSGSYDLCSCYVYVYNVNRKATGMFKFYTQIHMADNVLHYGFITCI